MGEPDLHAQDPGRRMDDELATIQARLQTLKARLDAFEPWDHAASAARLRALSADAARDEDREPLL